MAVTGIGTYASYTNSYGNTQNAGNKTGRTYKNAHEYSHIPARCPVDHAIWRLKPPVTASKSNTSPQKYKCLTSFDFLCMATRAIKSQE